MEPIPHGTFEVKVSILRLFWISRSEMALAAHNLVTRNFSAVMSAWASDVPGLLHPRGRRALRQRRGSPVAGLTGPSVRRGGPPTASAVGGPSRLSMWRGGRGVEIHAEGVSPNDSGSLHPPDRAPILCVSARSSRTNAGPSWTAMRRRVWHGDGRGRRRARLRRQ